MAFCASSHWFFAHLPPEIKFKLRVFWAHLHFHFFLYHLHSAIKLSLSQSTRAYHVHGSKIHYHYLHGGSFWPGQDFKTCPHGHSPLPHKNTRIIVPWLHDIRLPCCLHSLHRFPLCAREHNTCINPTPAPQGGEAQVPIYVFKTKSKVKRSFID